MRSIYSALSLREEAGGCFLCEGAPCSAACPHGVDPARAVRAVRFENAAGAALGLPAPLPCKSCVGKPCVSACAKKRTGRAVPVDDILIHTASARPAPPEADLSIEFCGVRCENPFFLSSSVVASGYDMIARAFDMGWAGAAFKTIGMFVPEEVSPRFDALRKENTPLIGFKNIEQISDRSAEENLACIRRLKRDYPSKVIIASVMGRSEEEWTELARLVTGAGADIVECNFSCPHMAEGGLGADVGQNPDLVAAFTRAARRGTRLPILAKMTPNLGNMEIPAIAAMGAGATGIAAINTIKSVMNVDLDTFSSGPDVSGATSVGGYSGKAVKPIALRFIQCMLKDRRLLDAPVSGMGGIETWRDAAEFIAMGCANVQVTTAVMQYGYRIVEDMAEGMRIYLTGRGMRSVSELVGRALAHIVPADSLDRSSICYPRFDRRKCVACGRCFVSCEDAGHQAIRRDAKGAPTLDGRRCAGCHLCVAVCPVEAVSPGARVKKHRTQGRHQHDIGKL